jgi:hypothetical protein
MVVGQVNRLAGSDIWSMPVVPRILGRHGVEVKEIR